VNETEFEMAISRLEPKIIYVNNKREGKFFYLISMERNKDTLRKITMYVKPEYVWRKDKEGGVKKALAVLLEKIKTGKAKYNELDDGSTVLQQWLDGDDAKLQILYERKL
jgi:hypothetical protein